jgi:hypothetical protein
MASRLVWISIALLVGVVLAIRDQHERARAAAEAAINFEQSK